MFENPRRSKQARNFTTNAPKILDLKSSSEQIFSRKLSLGAPVKCRKAKHDGKVIVSFLCLGCSKTFATILKSQPLLTLDLKAQGSKGMNSALPDKCNITHAQYLEQLSWKDLNNKEKDTFYIRRVPEWPYTNLTVCYVV